MVVSEEVLRVVGADAEVAELAVQCGKWSDGDAGVRSRPALAAPSGQRWLQRAVQPQAAGLDTACEQLENEIRSLLRLRRRYPAGYPESLPWLVGYQLDCELPYLLTTAPAGEPVAGWAGQLLLEDRQRLLVGLFRCLYHLDGADIVHGGVTLDTVFWDGTQVHLAGFGRALVRGEPVPVPGPAPWAAPGCRVGGGVADPGDDIWSAAMLAFHVITGHPVAGLAGPPELAGRESLAGILDGAFAPDPASRPSAERMLRRLRASEPLPPGGLEDPALAAGAAAFDEARRLKHPPPPAPPPPRPRPVSHRDPWWRRRRRGLVAVGIFAAAVVTVVVAALVVAP